MTIATVIDLGTGPDATILYMVTLGLDIGAAVVVHTWEPVAAASGTWVERSAASGTWVERSAATGTWVQVT